MFFFLPIFVYGAKKIFPKNTRAALTPGGEKSIKTAARPQRGAVGWSLTPLPPPPAFPLFTDF